MFPGKWSIQTAISLHTKQWRRNSMWPAGIDLHAGALPSHSNKPIHLPAPTVRHSPRMYTVPLYYNTVVQAATRTKTLLTNPPATAAPHKFSGSHAQPITQPTDRIHRRLKLQMSLQMLREPSCGLTRTGKPVPYDRKNNPRQWQ